MANESTMAARVLVVHFLVPVHDRRGKRYAHAARIWLRRDLGARFGGWSLVSDKPLEGAWRNPESGEIEYDASWRYEIGIDPSRLDELDAYLGELAYRLGQKAIWRVAYAGGEGRAIPAKEPAKR